MLKQITLDEFMAFRPCTDYPKTRIQKLYAGHETCNALDMLAWDIPVVDRIWAVTRSGVAPTNVLVKWAFLMAKRAVQRSIDFGFGVDCPLWLKWATDFVALTEIPAHAADAAAYAADATHAADAAAYAADAAADATHAAACAARAAACAARAAAYAADAAARAANREQQIVDLIALLSE